MASATLLLLLFVTPGSLGFQWSPSSLQPGAVVLVCEGDSVELMWGYTKEAAEQDNDIEWAFRKQGLFANNQLAIVFHGHFFTEPNIQQHLTFVPPSGLLLTGVTSQRDAGTYTITVDINMHDGSTVKYASNVTLLVVDPLVANNATMKVTRMPDVVFDNATGDFHVQLACEPTQPLGNIPINVQFITPDGHVLNSSGFANGTFYVDLPNPVVGGDYQCQVSNPQVTCLPSDAPLLAASHLYLDSCHAQLDVTTASLAKVKQELQKEKQDYEQCHQLLTAAPCIDHMIYDFDCSAVPQICTGPGRLVCPKFCHICTDNGAVQPPILPRPADPCYDRVGNGVMCSDLHAVCHDPLADVLCPKFCHKCP